MPRTKTTAVGRAKRNRRTEEWFSPEQKAERWARLSLSKTLCAPKFGTYMDLRNKHLPFAENIHSQGLSNFISFRHKWYPDLVKEFYINLTTNESTKEYETEVNGTRIVLSDAVFRRASGINNVGAIGRSDDHWESFERTSARRVYRSYLLHPNLYTQKHWKAGYLSAANRLLFFFLVQLLIPRDKNRAQPTTYDVFLMHVLLQTEKKLDWISVVREYMYETRLRKDLPYAMLISQILENVGAVPEGAIEIERTQADYWLTDANLGRMGIVKRDNEWFWSTPPRIPSRPMEPFQDDDEEGDEGTDESNEAAGNGSDEGSDDDDDAAVPPADEPEHMTDTPMPDFGASSSSQHMSMADLKAHIDFQLQAHHDALLQSMTEKLDAMEMRMNARFDRHFGGDAGGS